MQRSSEPRGIRRCGGLSAASRALTSPSASRQPRTRGHPKVRAIAVELVAVTEPLLDDAASARGPRRQWTRRYGVRTNSLMPLTARPAGYNSAIPAVLPTGLSHIRLFADGRRTGLGLT